MEAEVVRFSFVKVTINYHEIFYYKVVKAVKGAVLHQSIGGAQALDVKVLVFCPERKT